MKSLYTWNSRLPGALSRRPLPLPSLLGSLVAAGLLLGTACQEVPRRPHFEPERELSGRGHQKPGAARWRHRLQHTRGELGEDLFPLVSSDGRHLIFSTSRFSRGFDLAFKPLDGYALTFLTNGEHNDIHPSLSPDGTKLVFSSDRPGRWNLYLLDTAPGSEAVQLFPSDTDNLGPRWAPDGRRIVYFRRGAGQDRWEIWLHDVARGSSSYLTEGLFPAWSPDGEWIAFQKGRQRGEKWYSIWKIRADGSRLVDLMSGWSEHWGAIQPSWSADGEWLAFTAVGKGMPAYREATDRPPSSDVYLLSADGSQLVDLTGDRAGSSEWNPFFGADGRVYFTSDVGGSPRIWSVDSVKVGPASSSSRLNPASSPDGSSRALPAIPTGEINPATGPRIPSSPPPAGPTST